MTRTGKKTIALVVAAGRGTRLGGPVAKQYRQIGKASVLHHTLSAFEAHAAIDRVLTIIHPDDKAHFEAASKGLGKSLPPVNGGANRQDSVRLGLEALRTMRPDNVLIHDAARPFVSHEIISRVIDALAVHKGAIAALPVADTLKRVSNSVITGTCPRENLFRAQTPQGFHFQAILAAHQNAARKGELAFTDDAAVAEWAGIKVAVVEGAQDNSKITTAEDLVLADKKMKGDAEYRSGFGYDVHCFEAGASVTLCGVEIPHNQSLKGHSDADVALHAVTDALLGAVAEGDIGTHFPPLDQQWAGAASDRFVRFAAERIAARGGEILLVDITIICERPKIMPHREAMREKLAAMLGVPVDRVSIKATTTEGLGFSGRGEGMEAKALASIRIAKP